MNPQLRSTRNEGLITSKNRKIFNFFPESPKKSSLLRNSTHSKRGKFLTSKEKLLNNSDPIIDVKLGTPVVQFLKTRKAELLDFELSEILSYKTIYFCGDLQAKMQRTGKYKKLDDESGNLILFKHDHIVYRYEIIKILGYGSFGQVCECIDHKEDIKVAVKIVKTASNFRAQAETEIKILRFIEENSGSQALQVVHIKDSFTYRGHVCIVTELLGMNLYELQQSKNFSKFPTNLLKNFSIQILNVLKFFHDHKIIHCDLKLENILVTRSDKNSLKIIDFGSSCFIHEKIFSYIQSRYYRAPEIILNLNYNCSIDMWSFGCILAELATGKPLFPAECERELLQMIMQVKGSVPEDMLEKSIKRNKFFANGSIIPDKYGNVLQPGSKRLDEVVEDDVLFQDFLEGCLEWDPSKRMTPQLALLHPWLKQEEKLSKKSNIIKLLRRSKFFKK